MNSHLPVIFHFIREICFCYFFILVSKFFCGYVPQSLIPLSSTMSLLILVFFSKEVTFGELFFFFSSFHFMICTRLKNSLIPGMTTSEQYTQNSKFTFTVICVVMHSFNPITHEVEASRFLCT